MKVMLRALLLALSLLAAPSFAQAWTMPPTKIDADISCRINGNIGCWNLGVQAGPWYSYFPYNAHFQTPAPVGGWPYWPSAAAVQGVHGAIPQNQPNLQGMYGRPSGLQPVSYYGNAPSYWYGR